MYNAASNLQNVTDIPQSNNDETTQRYFRRYNVRSMPADFIKSDVAQQALVHCIDSILLTTETQDEIDNMYSHVCNLNYSEMDNWFRSNNINSKSRKKFRTSSKPYWSDELSDLWKEMCIAETNYLKSIQNTPRRRNLLKLFKNKQHTFDKAFKKSKRKFE